MEIGVQNWIFGFFLVFNFSKLDLKEGQFSLKGLHLKNKKISTNYKIVCWNDKMHTQEYHKNTIFVVLNHLPCNIQVLHTTILDEWVVGTACGAVVKVSS